MAIINCPECGEKISSTVNQCVHCGAKITVCPECNNVYTGHLETCPECGYILNIEKETINKSNVKEKNIIKTARQAEEKCNFESPLQKLYKSKSIRFILIGIECLLGIIAATKLINWHKNMTINYSNTLSSIKTCLIFLAIFDVVSNMYDVIAPILSKKDFLSWIKNKGINLRNLIDTSFSQDFENMIPDDMLKNAVSLQNSIDCEIYDADITVKSKTITSAIIIIFIESLISILICIFTCTNVEIYMSAELWRSDTFNTPGFDISMISNWWLLILSGIIFVGKLVYSSIYEKQCESIKENWIRKNMPNNIDKYQIYIKDPDDRVIDKKVDNFGRNL